MSVFQRIPISSLVVDTKRPVKLAAGSNVWNLNLDQIEPDTGRVLKKEIVPAEKLGPSTYPFEPGTVLYSKLRPYLNKVVVSDDMGMATTELVPLRCDVEKVLPEYLAYYLRSPEFLRFASIAVAGAKMPRMVMAEFWSYKIPLPSLSEQRRIAAILDQADALRVRRREAIAQLDSLTQSVFIEMFGDPAAGKPRSEVHQLESLLEEGFQNGAYFQKEAYRADGGVEMVHMSDAFNGVILRGGLKRVSCGVDELKKYLLTTDDILIARRSLTYEGAAKPCMIPYSNEPLIFESSFIRVKPDKKRITPLYLFHYLNNERVRQKHVRPYVTQSTIAGINQSNLSQVPVLLPPINQQQDFGTRITAIDRLKLIYEASLTSLEQLFTSLQHRAFRGEI